MRVNVSWRSAYWAQTRTPSLANIRHPTRWTLPSWSPSVIYLVGRCRCSLLTSWTNNQCRPVFIAYSHAQSWSFWLEAHLGEWIRVCERGRPSLQPSKTFCMKWFWELWSLQIFIIKWESVFYLNSWFHLVTKRKAHPDFLWWTSKGQRNVKDAREHWWRGNLRFSSTMNMY